MKALSILLPGGQEGSFSLDILLSPPSHTKMQGLAFFIRDLSDPPSFHSCKSLSPSRLKKPSADDAPTTLHTQTCFGRGRRGKEVPYPFHPLPRIKITPSTSPPFSPIACKWRFVRKPFSRIGLAGGKEGNAQSPTYHFNKGKSKSRAFFITAQTPVFPPLSSLLKRIILRLFQFPFFGSSPLAAQIAPNSFSFSSCVIPSRPPSFSFSLSISFLLPLPRGTGV